MKRIFKKHALKGIALITSLLVSANSFAFLDRVLNTGTLNTAVNAAGDAVKAATVSDAEVRNIATQYAKYSDSKNKIAPPSSKYAKRLARITAKHRNVDGMKFNYKVYMTDQINAFALADGNVRVYSGLMDRMNDEELLGVIGHEIGHVILGHHASRLRTAYLASAAKKGAIAAANSTYTYGGRYTGGLLSNDALARIGENLVNKQFSQANEKEADDYGLKFLRKSGNNPCGMVNAMKVLAGLNGGGSALSSITSTHPNPQTRVERLYDQLNDSEKAKCPIK